MVLAASEADVQETVAFAAAHKLPLCVRAGGHDVSGASLCNGVLLMLEKLNKVGRRWGHLRGVHVHIRGSGPVNQPLSSACLTSG